jgi:hypothetical protein
VRRLLRPVPLAVLAMLSASAVAVHGFVETVFDLSLFCSGDPLRGANISHGLAAAFLGGIVIAFLLAVVRRPRLVLVALGLGVAVLALAIAFVAVDSATYIQQNSTCGMFSPSTGSVSGRVNELYWAWGVAIAVLLVQVARVLRAGPPTPPQRQYDPWAWSQPRPESENLS